MSEKPETYSKEEQHYESTYLSGTSRMNGAQAVERALISCAHGKGENYERAHARQAPTGCTIAGNVVILGAAWIFIQIKT